MIEKITSPSELKGLSVEQLESLAGEIREVVLERVSEIGGHLASNLGVVELTIALHRVFDSPRDKMVWDVGHQCYPHKLLTGRYHDFDMLRLRDGISGFPKRSESEHDCFDTGHGSTSISAALGMAVGRDLNGEKSHVIGICGDGAMSGGMVFEAINHGGDLGTNLIVVLNDNSYSISPVTGALGRSLSRIRMSNYYVRIHKKLHSLKESPSAIFGLLSFITAPARGLAKYLAYKKGIIFEELGYTYVGPVDGHNIGEMMSVMEKIKGIDGPVLLHVLTTKGKGYHPAENDPASFHGVSRLKSGQAEKVDIRPGKTFTAAFTDAMIGICEKDNRVVGITAAMPDGTGVQKLMEKFPGRFFDVGMAEQHAVTFAAGLACKGLRPVVAIYSTFLQRAYDQVFHDVCLQNLPVVFALDRAGLVDRYGPTHQGILDIAYLRHLPNMTMMAPRDTDELAAMLEYAFALDGPVAIRYPGASDASAVKMTNRKPIELGRAETLCEGTDVSIWAAGVMAEPALKAAKILQQKEISARVVNPRFIRPLDEKLILEEYNLGIRRFATVEDHVLEGGFGSLFLETLRRLGLDGAKLEMTGVEKFEIADDSRAALLEDFKLTPDGIAESIEMFVRGSLGKTGLAGG